VWIADGNPIAAADLWWFLGTLAAAASTVLVAFISVRRAKPSQVTQQKRVRSASDEAVREYRKLMVDEVKRLQARVTAAEDRAETFRRGWDECEQQRLGGG
jgi:hypothetical protein